MSSPQIEHTVDELLGRFPGPITLNPSQEKWRVHTVLTAIFTAGVILLIVFGQMGTVFRIFTIFVAIVFGGCTVLGIVILLPGALSLQLDKDGFEIVKLYRKRRLRWAETSDFSLWTFKQAQLIAFNSTALPSTKAGALAMKANRLLALRNDYLPDTFGLSARDMVEFINAWRNRAIQSVSPDAVPSVSQSVPTTASPPKQNSLKGPLVHLSGLSGAALYLIGAVLVVALIVLSSKFESHLSKTTDFQTDILSDHGPRRVICDSQWVHPGQSNPGAYRDFLLRCMKGNP